MKRKLALLGFAVMSFIFLITCPFDPVKYNFWYDITHKDKLNFCFLTPPPDGVAMYWKEEVARRYSDGVLVFAHGGPSFTSYWGGMNEIEDTQFDWIDMVQTLHNKYPHRRLILISCNPSHQYLKAERVTYAIESVWFYPDSVMRIPLGLIQDDSAVGNIFDFIEQ